MDRAAASPRSAQPRRSGEQLCVFPSEGWFREAPETFRGEF